MPLTDTIAAIATPPGTGALAILRVSGPQARGCAAAVLGRGKESLRPREAAVAMARDRDGELDRVVAVFFPERQSPTGEDLVELSCHGAPYIQRRLLSALLENGARPARPGEFTQRAYLNGRLDLAQAEAVCDLIRAGTDLAHRQALLRLEGGLSQQVARLRAPILDLLVQLEAGLDHPEEDVPASPPETAAARFSALAEPVARLLDTFRTGRLINEGARVCIVGRTNAGKSSLLNSLLGCDRAIVSEEPGTTRDTLEEPCDLAGVPALLVDTAGLGHPARGEADAQSLLRTERALRASDLALLVVDGSRPATPEDESAHRRVLESSAAEGRPVVVVLNKADLPAPADGPGRRGACAVSALRGLGLDELKRLIARRLTRDSGPPAEDGGVAIASARHHSSLSRCVGELREAAGCTRSHPGCWEELAARHLREALAAIDELTGAGAPDEVLREIFSRFCLGK
jgi:tRNA modification GTPase